MTQTELATQTKAAQIERVVIENDLSKLSPDERLAYYIQTCDALGLTWQTKPFSYLNLNGKLTLYATRDCTDQLREKRHVSISKLERERIDDIYVVTATATTPDGRTDSSIGAVTIGTLKGDALANALMKAETKAKRRVTLSICGLGMTDETEVETIPGARIIEPDALPAAVEGDEHGNGAASDKAKPKKARSRQELEDRYTVLCGEAKEWNDSDRLPTIEYLTFKPEWSDDELTVAGRTLAAALDQVTGRQPVPA